MFETEFRPVPLDEFVKVGNIIYTPKMEVARIIRKEASLGGKDPDHVVELCYEVCVQKKKHVLVNSGDVDDQSVFIHNQNPKCYSSRELINLHELLIILYTTETNFTFPLFGSALNHFIFKF